MEKMEPYAVFLDLAIIIIAAKFFGLVARKCKAPQVVGEIIAGLIIGLAGLLTGWIPVVGPVLGIILSAIGTLVEVYTVAGIVIKFLAYFNVLKD
jgi:Kef-type K+ transport system membrane component KefB